MFSVCEESLEKYPTLCEYLKAKGKLNRFLSPEDYEAVYVIHVVGSFKTPKERDFCLLEICVMMGLEPHIDDISEQADILPQIQRRQYRAFRLAIANRHLDIADKLLALSGANPLYMIRPFNYRVFKYGIETGDIFVVLKLITLAQEERDKMFSSHGYLGINTALEKSYQDIVFCLLRYSANFTYLSKQKKYHNDLFDFIERYIPSLPDVSETLDSVCVDLILCIIPFILDKQQSGAISQDECKVYLTKLIAYPAVHKLLTS